MNHAAEQLKFLVSDLRRCWGAKEPFPAAFLFSPFLWLTSWTILYYRICRFMLLLPTPFRVLLAPLRHIIKRVGQVITGTDVSEKADIGPRFFIAHNGTLVIGGLTKAGSNFFVRQGVTIGGDGVNYGHPSFGDNVILGANVVVIGGISIGSNVVVGANSVVRADLPDNVVAVGAPAKVVRNRTELESGMGCQ